MFFHVILTTQCNLQCRYCSGEVLDDFSQPRDDIDYSLPEVPSYTIDELKRFVESDPEAVIIFYGGEPFLAADLMVEIMNEIRTNAFIVQTNGTLLKELEPAHLRRLHTVAVSLDGDEAQTDLNRGVGTFRKVIENLRWARREGFNGELIARMTATEPLDIYLQVRWLLENEEFKFSSVHWQLNAGFWSDYGKRDFEKWTKEVYNPGIVKLVKYWVDQMENGRGVLRLYPFMGIVESLLKGETALLRCGAGWTNYAIQTDGHIIPCPAMWGIKKYYFGHVKDLDALKLKKVLPGEPCVSCRIYEICGGRCLYANVMKRWDYDEYRAVCNTVENMANALKKELPRIKSLIREGIIKQENFMYMKFNGCEIIP